MKTEFASTADLIENGSIFPLEIIPNYMGINLCSVRGIRTTRQEDGQLVSLTIEFIPAERTHE